MIGEHLPTISLASEQNASNRQPAALASVENMMTKSATTIGEDHFDSKHDRSHAQLLLQRQDAFGLGDDADEHELPPQMHKNNDVTAPSSFSLNWLLDDGSVPDFAITPSVKRICSEYEDTDEDDTTSSWYFTSDDEDFDSDSSSIHGLSYAPGNERAYIADQQSQQHKRVTFGNICIREYACIMGDHPLCTDACPISLDWNYYTHELPILISSFPAQNLSHTKSRYHPGFVRRLTYEERYCRALLFDG